MKAARFSSNAVARASHRAQAGASLITALIFLMLITLMAVSSTWQGVTQQQLAAGQRQSSLALAGADSAARVAERWLYTFYSRSHGEALVGTADGANGIHTFFDGHAPAQVQAFFSGPAWTTEIGVEVSPDELDFGDAHYTARLAQPPVYLIEDLGALRPSGASTVQEGGGTGGLGYASGGLQPGGNDELRIFRITAKSKSINSSPVRTVQSVFAGRPKG